MIQLIAFVLMISALGAQAPARGGYQPKIPSDNAFDYYMKAYESLVGEYPWNETGNVLGAEGAAYLKANAQAFAYMAKAYEKPCRAPDWYSENAALLPFHAKYRHLARILNLQIRWDIMAEDGSDVVKHAGWGLKMAPRIN